MFDYFPPANYVTKHHPTKHHQAVQPVYVSNNVQQFTHIPSAKSTPIAINTSQRKILQLLHCKGVLKLFMTLVVTIDYSTLVQS